MKNTLAFLSLLLIFTYQTFSQINLPYRNGFDSPSDTVGWSHYALNGTDDWQWGVPTGVSLNRVLTAPFAFGTNLNGKFTAQSLMCLESPSFDLSDTSEVYVLGFAHQYATASYHGGNVEYSINGGSWRLLNGQSHEKSSWHSDRPNNGLGGQPGWSGYASSSFRTSYHSLEILKGESDIRFRFKFGGTTNPTEGWLIDDVFIIPNSTNLYGVQAAPFYATKECSMFDINLTMVYAGLTRPLFTNKVEYYWSEDSIFDAGDPLIGTKGTTTSSTINWNKSFSLPSNVSVGTYYVFFKVDVEDLMNEWNETDNLGRAEVIIEPIYQTPIISHFDDTVLYWDKKGRNNWELGQGEVHHYEGTHSGEYSWKITGTNTYTIDYLESQHLDLSQEDSTIISFWYVLRSDVSTKNHKTIRYRQACESTTTHIVGLPQSRDNTWDFFNAYLPEEADTSKDIRLRIYNGTGDASQFSGNGLAMMLDDIYVGKAKADLSIERDKSNRHTTTNTNTETIKYFLNNGGLKSAPTFAIDFYWSTDSIWDASDVLLGTKQESSLPDTSRMWEYFTFTKPTTNPGVYYIHYVLDPNNVVDEMREYNNTGYFTLSQEPLKPYIYFNDFENQVDGWRHNSSVGLDDWEWTSPKGNFLDTAFSGTKAWITQDTGLVSPMSRMHLYTPVFDFSTAINPVISFDMKLHSHPSCHCFEGKTNMSYSIDGGATWQILDTTSQSFNRWYYKIEYSAFGDRVYGSNYTYILSEPVEHAFVALNQYNSRDARRNTRYILDLTFLAGQANVQFRFNLGTLTNNEESPNYTVEGAMIDNFTIDEATIDLAVDYELSLMQSSLSDKVKFYMQIKNQGNYISNPTTAKYYLSVDKQLDGADFYLGLDSIPEIRPDLYFYVNNAFDAPPNLGAFNYLLYELDADQSNQESLETNNVGSWDLALDSISTYPYFHNFNNPFVDGWYQFTSGYGSRDPNIYRFRNIVAPGEPLFGTDIQSGEWFTEPIRYYGGLPYFYLETPSFSFRNMDSIILSFDLMCVGNRTSVPSTGGHLEFSTDGGNTWAILTDQQGDAQNWYNDTYLSAIAGPGWAHRPAGWYTARWDSVKIDISFLAQEEHVVFRFKYRNNYSTFGGVEGLRVDNFSIYKKGSQFTYLSPISICQGESAFIFGKYYDTPGQYQDTLQTSIGRDSVLIQELIVQPVDTTVIQTGFGYTLAAQAQSATYQWLDCANGYAPIPGETSQTFTASTNGSYALEVSTNGCTDTSACYVITTVGIEEQSFPDKISVYPNPISEVFHIDMGRTYSQILVEIYDIQGIKVHQEQVQMKQTFNISTKLTDGMYFMTLTSGDKYTRVKLVKN